MRLQDLVLDVARDDHASDVFDLFADDVGQCADSVLEIRDLPLHGLDSPYVKVLFLKEGLDVLRLVRLQLVHRRLNLIQLLSQVQGTVASCPVRRRLRYYY